MCRGPSAARRPRKTGHAAVDRWARRGHARLAAGWASVPAAAACAWLEPTSANWLAVSAQAWAPRAAVLSAPAQAWAVSAQAWAPRVRVRRAGRTLQLQVPVAP